MGKVGTAVLSAVWLSVVGAQVALAQMPGTQTPGAAPQTPGNAPAAAAPPLAPPNVGLGSLTGPASGSAPTVQQAPTVTPSIPESTAASDLRAPTGTQPANTGGVPGTPASAVPSVGALPPTATAASPGVGP
jgi:hypothetical protein